MERAPDLRTLERLPYLAAVIKEALRLTSGVTTGLSRVVPPEGAGICGTVVPGKTIVSCGNTFVHYNVDTFNDPMAFSPERWLEDPELDKWLVPFSKGPRMCLGINLAWAELRLTFARVFHKFDMELDSSSPQELLWHDKFLPTYYGGHVKAKMTAVSS
ncbi:cytochrome P450 [Cryomyces antarcticus]